MSAAMADTSTAQGKALREKASKMLDKIAASQKLEGEWLKSAGAATLAYIGEMDKDVSETGTLYEYNILHANVETIIPAVINSSPIPDIRRRFLDTDEDGRQVAELIERAISVQVDDNALDVELEMVAQDAFLGGRGIIRMRYENDDEDTPANTPGHEELQEQLSDTDSSTEETEEALQLDPAEMMPSAMPMPVGDGLTAPPGAELLAPEPPPKNERITFEAVSWRDFAHGPARRWRDVPWQAFRHRMSPDEAEEFSSNELTSIQNDPSLLAGEKRDGDIDVWEFWNRKDRKVYFLNGDTREAMKIVDDPMRLTKFFPTADPVQPLMVNGRLTPVCPFNIYKALADELDRITKRIRRLTEGLKARGLVIGMLKEIQKLADLDDNELAPIEDVEQAAAAGGLDKMITWWPIDRIILVIKELVAQREITKAAIYEITGISDIVRGASKASETLGAQQIKTQWGSLRIQKMQRAIERAARDLFQMMSEAIPQLFSKSTLSAISGMEITPEMEALMKDPIRLRYRVDVESNSTVRADVSARKGEMSEFLTGSAQYFAAVGPLVQQGALPPEVAIGIYTATARLFKLGKSIEDLLEGMVKQAQDAAKPPTGPDGQPLPPGAEQLGPDGQPMPPPPTPEELQAQAEQALAQQEQQAAAAEAQARLDAITMKTQDDRKLARINRQIAMAKLAEARAKAVEAGAALLPIVDPDAEQPLDPNAL